jgi:hypothetical protein
VSGGTSLRFRGILLRSQGGESGACPEAGAAGACARARAGAGAGRGLFPRPPCARSFLPLPSGSARTARRSLGGRSSALRLARCTAWCRPGRSARGKQDAHTGGREPAWGPSRGTAAGGVHGSRSEARAAVGTHLSQSGSGFPPSPRAPGTGRCPICPHFGRARPPQSPSGVRRGQPVGVPGTRDPAMAVRGALPSFPPPTSRHPAPGGGVCLRDLWALEGRVSSLLRVPHRPVQTQPWTVPG